MIFEKLCFLKSNRWLYVVFIPKNRPLFFDLHTHLIYNCIIIHEEICNGEI